MNRKEKKSRQSSPEPFTAAVEVKARRKRPKAFVLKIRPNDCRAVLKGVALALCDIVDDQSNHGAAEVEELERDVTVSEVGGAAG